MFFSFALLILVMGSIVPSEGIDAPLVPALLRQIDRKCLLIARRPWPMALSAVKTNIHRLLRHLCVLITYHSFISNTVSLTWEMSEAQIMRINGGLLLYESIIIKGGSMSYLTKREEFS